MYELAVQVPAESAQPSKPPAKEASPLALLGNLPCPPTEYQLECWLKLRCYLTTALKPVPPEVVPADALAWLSADSGAVPENIYRGRAFHGREVFATALARGTEELYIAWSIPKVTSQRGLFSRAELLDSMRICERKDIVKHASIEELAGHCEQSLVRLEPQLEGILKRKGIACPDIGSWKNKRLDFVSRAALGLLAVHVFAEEHEEAEPPDWYCDLSACTRALIDRAKPAFQQLAETDRNRAEDISREVIPDIAARLAQSEPKGWQRAVSGVFYPSLGIVSRITSRASEFVQVALKELGMVEEQIVLLYLALRMGGASLADCGRDRTRSLSCRS